MDTLSRKVIYQGRIVTLRIDEVANQDGKVHAFEIVDHRDAVTILPLDADGNVWFVRQYRHAVEADLLELPAGVSEANEPPEISAQRELQEEIGMAAGQLEKLGSFWLAPGYSTEYMHVFLARELYPSSLPADEDEAIEIVKLPWAEAITLAERGEFKDSKSLITLMWASRHLK
jgi:ADP-ribose pyrophosphatase